MKRRFTILSFFMVMCVGFSAFASDPIDVTEYYFPDTTLRFDGTEVIRMKYDDEEALKYFNSKINRKRLVAYSKELGEDIGTAYFVSSHIYIEFTDNTTLIYGYRDSVSGRGSFYIGEDLIRATSKEISEILGFTFPSEIIIRDVAVPPGAISVLEEGTPIPPLAYGYPAAKQKHLIDALADQIKTESASLEQIRCTQYEEICSVCEAMNRTLKNENDDLEQQVNSLQSELDLTKEELAQALNDESCGMDGFAFEKVTHTGDWSPVTLKVKEGTEGIPELPAIPDQVQHVFQDGIYRDRLPSFIVVTDAAGNRLSFNDIRLMPKRLEKKGFFILRAPKDVFTNNDYSNVTTKIYYLK